MSADYVQLTADQGGKKVQTALNATEHAQYTAVIDASGFSNSYVEVSESTGKKMQTFANIIGGQTVHALAITTI